VLITGGASATNGRTPLMLEIRQCLSVPFRLFGVFTRLYIKRRSSFRSSSTKVESFLYGGCYTGCMSALAHWNGTTLYGLVMPGCIPGRLLTGMHHLYGLVCLDVCGHLVT